MKSESQHTASRPQVARLRRLALPLGLALSLLASAVSAQQRILLTGVNLSVAGNNAVTVNTDGALQLFGDVGGAGTFAFINGWGYTSGDADWRDTNNNTVARINSAAGVQVPVANRICNGNGPSPLNGSVRLSGNTTLGAALRATFGTGSGFAYTSVISSGGGRDFAVSGTVNIAAATPDRTLLSGVNLDVAGDNTVTVNTNGTLLLFGSVAGAGTFPFINGWGYTSGDADWRDTNNNTVARINSAAGVQVPVANRICNGNGPSPLNGSVRLSGNTTLGAALRATFGTGSGFAYSSIISSGGGLTFGVSGTVNIAAVGPPQADVGITKSDGVATAVPGSNTTYTIVASNAGPAAAPAALVTDTFPAACTAVNWTCVGAGGGTCPANGMGNLNTPVNLPAGGSVTFTATCTISPAVTGSLANTATVAPGMGLVDPSMANNSATDTDTLTPQADVAITKSDGTTTAVPGNNTTYTIVASNAGPSHAPAAVVTDTFPAACTSVTWTCVGAGGGSCPANGAGNLNTAVNLPVGGSATFTATCAISPAATGNLVNTAMVAPGAGVTDPAAGNNSATDSDTLTPQADVAITKSDGTTTAVPGTDTTYAIVASNSGPSHAPAALVTDTFPAACTSVNWTCVGAGGGTCPANGSGNLNATVNLPAGGSATFTATCAISPAATGDLVNTATVAPGAGVTDPAAGNNSATDTDTLTPQADVSVVKTASPTAVDVGDTITFTIVVANAGPSSAPGVLVEDYFPVEFQSGLVWTCSGQGGGTCTAAGSGDIVDLADLPPGASVTYVATCSAFAATDGDVTNTASVTLPAGVIDPDPSNQDDSVTVTIDAFAIQEIPTLDARSLALLALLLGAAGWLALRRLH